MNAPILWRVAIFAALIVTTSTAFGQRGGFSPDRMFDMLDRDQSGVLEPEEIENSYMSRMVDGMGLDTSRGITRDQLSDSMDEMRRRMEERGFGGRGGFRGGFADRGGFGGGGRGFGGDDDDEERDGEGRRGWWSRGGDEDDGDGDSRRGPSRGRGEDRRNGRTDSRSTSTKVPEPPPRVTLDLPAQFVAGDADRDGQIGMYEWTKWKSRAALAEFLGLDRNGDGFLTPRELSRAHEAKLVDLATALPIGPTASRSQSAVLSAAATDAASPPEMASSSPENTRQSEQTSLVSLAANDEAVIAAADEQVVRKAKYDFSLLDRNRDGVLSELEWRISKTLKPRFEKAGVDLAQPMSSDQFVSHYVRIYAADGSS